MARKPPDFSKPPRREHDRSAAASNGWANKARKGLNAGSAHAADVMGLLQELIRLKGIYAVKKILEPIVAEAKLTKPPAKS